MIGTVILYNGDYTLIQVNEVDDDGQIIQTRYEVYTSPPEKLGMFPSLAEAQQFFNSLVEPEPEPPSKKGPHTG